MTNTLLGTWNTDVALKVQMGTSSSQLRDMWSTLPGGDSGYSFSWAVCPENPSPQRGEKFEATSHPVLTSLPAFQQTVEVIA